MTARIDWFGFAEGAATDIRGSLTLVGFSPMILTYQQLPADTSLALVLLLADDGEPEQLLPDRDLNLDVHILAPDGVVLVGAQQSTKLAQQKHPDLPAVATAVMATKLVFGKTGRYRAEVSIKISETDVELNAQRDIYVTLE